MFKLSNMSVVIKTAVVLGAITASALAMGQEEKQLEEVVVVGSQIKGATINTALPVSIISADDIDALGLDWKICLKWALTTSQRLRLSPAELTLYAVILDRIT